MAKIRVNKLALELGLQNDQIIEALQKKKIPVKNLPGGTYQLTKIEIPDDDASTQLQVLHTNAHTYLR